MSLDVNASSVLTRQLTNFAAEAAEFILEQGRLAVEQRGLFRLGLAGGNTPRQVYDKLAETPFFPWEKTQITFGDERCVGPEDPQSNYLMAKLSLLDKVAIPAGNIFRIRGEIEPVAAAQEFEGQIGAMAQRLGEPRYRHDVLLLGMGEDGHTASLFPGSPALEETERNAIATIGPKPPPQRITMTFPLINASRQVVFLVTRKGKEAVLGSVLAGDQQYPSARVKPTEGRVVWLLGD